MTDRRSERETASALLLKDRLELLRAKIRRQIGPGLRAYFDTDDVMSTVLRHIDNYIAAGKADIEHVNQLWALVDRVTARQVASKARIADRLRRATALDREPADAGTRSQESDDELFMRAMQCLPSDESRSVLWLRIVCELTHREIGLVLGLTEEAARFRLHYIRNTLRDQLWKQGPANS
jgi:DNA-directed RNA polymerase specialized sigma24 family protein